jgi:hypothetical protein
MWEPPQLILGCRWYALLLARSCKYTTCIMRSSWCYWSAVGCDSRFTVVEVCWRRCCLEDCWECCSSLRLARWGCAVQWSPMEPESWSGWFPLKFSTTCSYRWLHCDLQNVPREHPNCTAGTVRVIWSEVSWILTDWAELRCLLNCLEPYPIVNTALNNSCIVAVVRHHENPVYRAVAWIPICVSVTWLSKFLICGRFPWEAPT